MGKVVAVAVVVALVGAVGLAWAKETKRVPTATVLLTEEQVTAVKSARGDATITLNSAQMETINKTLPNVTSTKLTLSTSHVVEGNKVIVIEGARGEANPQPSP